MSKFTPSLTGNKEYSLSLVAINQRGTRCDIIWSYIDDDGDEMFIREFRDNFIRHVRKTAISPKYGYKQNVERVFTVRGCYATFNHVCGLCVRANLGLRLNEYTGRYYTVVTRLIREVPDEFTMCSTRPYFWLTDEAFFGFEELSVLDRQYTATISAANRQLDEEVHFVESGKFDEAMAEVNN